MVTCTFCGSNVTGKKFCPDCGSPVQPTSMQAVSNQFLQTCSRCNGEVKPGTSFCMHCGAALNSSTYQPTHMTPAPAGRSCPVCHAQVAGSTMFCTQCGHDMRVAVAPQSMAGSAFCTQCGKSNDPGVRFCGGCGSQVGAMPQTGYTQSGQYSQYSAQNTTQSPYQDSPYSSPPQQSQYSSPPQQSQYSSPPQQSQYSSPPQYPQPQFPYSQQYAGQGGYQPEPMVGQAPVVLRCPTCMAMSPMGTPNCVSCRTSLAGIVPTPVNMPAQGQQGLGGLLQGNAGKYAMGALGGAAAILGGELLMHGVENSIENRVEGDLGMGSGRHHHRNEGLLGGLGELVDDIGL